MAENLWLRDAAQKARREVLRTLAQGKKTILKLRLGQHWRKSDGGFVQRQYPDYAAYLRHQRVKLDAARSTTIAGYDQRFYAALRQRIDELPTPVKGRSVLCLAARQGTEVRAFIDAGAFAVGIDLNPGAKNRYVVVGDFHDLQFAAESVDMVYTNALDHAFDLDRIVAEVKRVLVPGGILIADVGGGTEAGVTPGFYESLAWSNVEEMLARLEGPGLQLERRRSFQMPGVGEQLVMKKPTERPETDATA